MTAMVTLKGDLDLKSSKYDQNKILGPQNPQKSAITHDCRPLVVQLGLSLTRMAAILDFSYMASL